MRIVEEYTIQRCRACDTQFEIEKGDCIVNEAVKWLTFRCGVCQRLNELSGIPMSFRDLMEFRSKK